MRVCLVGVGALGSHTALLLRNLPIQLRLIDFDKVEARNILSQFHPRTVVGRNKAQALQQTLHALYNWKVDAVPHRLSAENVEVLLADAGLVVDCLDNAASRSLLQNFVRARAIPCVHGALAPDGQLGRVVWDDLFTIDAEDTPGQATCEGGAHLPFVASVAATLSVAIDRFVRRSECLSTQIMPAGSLLLDLREAAQGS